MIPDSIQYTGVNHLVLSSSEEPDLSESHYDGYVTIEIRDRSDWVAQTLHEPMPIQPVPLNFKGVVLTFGGIGHLTPVL